MKPVLLELVMAVRFTVRVKLCIALGVTPLLAVMVMGYVPPVPAAGVPLSTPAGAQRHTTGNAPVSLKVGTRETGCGHRE